MPDGGRMSITTRNIYIDSPVKGFEHVAKTLFGNLWLESNEFKYARLQFTLVDSDRPSGHLATIEDHIVLSTSC